MKYLLFLMAFVFIGCAGEDGTEWPSTLAINSTDGRTSWRVVVIAESSTDEQVFQIPDYATEVIVIREGTGALTIHRSPELRDYVVSHDQDSLRIRVR